MVRKSASVSAAMPLAAAYDPRELPVASVNDCPNAKPERRRMGVTVMMTSVI